jgi:hypothetical protein
VRAILPTLTVCLLVAGCPELARAFACEDADAFDPGAFLYTRPGVDFGLTAASTIEWWMYLEDAPGVNDVWPIATRPGSYFVGFAGPLPAMPGAVLEPDEMFLVLSEVRAAGDGVTTLHRYITGVNPPRRAGIPLRRWVHVAIQRSPEDGWRRTVHIDKVRAADARGQGPRRPTDGSLYVFGIPAEDGADLTTLAAVGGTVAPLNGCIDVMRMSDRARYVTDEIVPGRRLRADRHTFARWEFAAPTSTYYGDTSGNGRHLFPGGSLSVSRLGTTATLWGELRAVQSPVQAVSIR